jgi:hypothetical protein
MPRAGIKSAVRSVRVVEGSHCDGNVVLVQAVKAYEGVEV